MGNPARIQKPRFPNSRLPRRAFPAPCPLRWETEALAAVQGNVGVARREERAELFGRQSPVLDAYVGAGGRLAHLPQEPLDPPRVVGLDTQRGARGRGKSLRECPDRSERVLPFGNAERIEHRQERKGRGVSAFGTGEEEAAGGGTAGGTRWIGRGEDWAIALRQNSDATQISSK